MHLCSSHSASGEVFGQTVFKRDFETELTGTYSQRVCTKTSPLSAAMRAYLSVFINHIYKSVYSIFMRYKFRLEIF